MKLICFLCMTYLTSNIAILAASFVLELRVSKRLDRKCLFFQKQFLWMWPAILAFGLPVAIAVIKERASKGE